VAVPLLTLGRGFNRLSLSDAEAVGEATLIASTVTVVDAGIIAGAVYRPAAEIVPVAALPPVTLFTCQVTAWLEAFATAAENCVVAPSRTVLAPLIVTEATAVALLVPLLPVEHPAKPIAAAVDRTETDSRIDERAPRERKTVMEFSTRASDLRRRDVRLPLSRLTTPLNPQVHYCCDFS
jgi:hypothetical protein